MNVICTYSHANDSFVVEGLIARCRELGVNHVCLTLDGVPGTQEMGMPDPEWLRQFVAQLADAGIQVPTAMVSSGRDPDVFLRPQAHRREIDAKLRTFATLRSAGIGALLYYLHMAPPEDLGDEQRYWDAFLAVHREIVAAAEAADVRIANHAVWACLPDPIREQALRDGVVMADYPRFRAEGWHGPWLMRDHTHVIRVMKEVPSDYNGACFCTGMHIMGGDVPALVETFKGKIFHAQMRDVRGRWPAAEEVFYGLGDLDFDRILRLLEQAGYTGVLGVEHFGSPRLVGAAPGTDLTPMAVAYLRDKLAGLQAGVPSAKSNRKSQ